MENTVIVEFHHKKRNTWLDMEIPLECGGMLYVYGRSKNAVAWRPVAGIVRIAQWYDYTF